MSNIGKLETWKVVYSLKVQDAGKVGVAIVEADTKQWAIKTFMDQYAGQYFTVISCEKLIK